MIGKVSHTVEDEARHRKPSKNRRTSCPKQVFLRVKQTEYGGWSLRHQQYGFKREYSIFSRVPQCRPQIEKGNIQGTRKGVQGA